MIRPAACGLAALLLLAAALPAAAHVHALDFGKTKEGEVVRVYHVKNNSGMNVRIMTRGATVVGIDAPDRNGKMADVTFGFDNVTGYESKDNGYFGAIVGRYAN